MMKKCRRCGKTFDFVERYVVVPNSSEDTYFCSECFSKMSALEYVYFVRDMSVSYFSDDDPDNYLYVSDIAPYGFVQ